MSALVQNSLICVLLSSVLAPASYAAPCYGTVMPAKHKGFVGAQTHVINKRYLEGESGHVRSAQHFFLLSFGLYDWLSIDLKGGAGFIKQHPPGSDELDYPSDFAGGYGFRLRFFNQAKTRMVFGFQHISVHPERIHLGDVKHTAILDDWQVSWLGSYGLGSMTPYLGVKLSRLDYIHWREEDRKRTMSDLTKALGMVAGLDIPLTKRMRLNLEVQAVDTEAMSISLNVAF